MKRLWFAFSAVCILSFAVLGWIGVRIYQEMPPLPDRVVTTAGNVVIPSGAITRGQNVWQSLGGMQVGSIWGHGSYVAPDWTADWLHREVTFVLDEWAGAEFSRPYEQLSMEDKAKLRGRLEEMYRRNDFDASTNTLQPPGGTCAEHCFAHSDVFINGNRTTYSNAPCGQNACGVRGLHLLTVWSGGAKPDDTELYEQLVL